MLLHLFYLQDYCNDFARNIAMTFQHRMVEFLVPFIATWLQNHCKTLANFAFSSSVTFLTSYYPGGSLLQTSMRNMFHIQSIQYSSILLWEDQALTKRVTRICNQRCTVLSRKRHCVGVAFILGHLVFPDSVGLTFCVGFGFLHLTTFELNYPIATPFEDNLMYLSW